jgi:cell wall-associated NlpC family hydrolase
MSPAEAVRATVVAEARSWARTPWHHEGRVKGAGVDCAMFLIEVFVAAGLIEPPPVEHYPPDWALHRDEPRFLAILRELADPVDAALPGDVAMFKFGRHAAHGAIVIQWPRIVHAYAAEGCVVESDVGTNVQLASRLAGFWRLRALKV